MLSALYLLVFLAAGVGMIRLLLPRFRMIGRIYLGLCAGTLLCMWLPAVTAFAVGFTVGGHLAALGLLALLFGACFLCRADVPQDHEMYRKGSRCVNIYALDAEPAPPARPSDSRLSARGE